jgi:hypothetical protein
VNNAAKAVLGALFKSGGLADAKPLRNGVATGFSAQEHLFLSEQSEEKRVHVADWKPWRGIKPMGVPIAV